ncbi:MULTISPECIES: hypothetical protein [unclassified Yoonia]|uniref:hypothetical protein n=1 Tax=unclassified Yoonia TaxID=2629118 RepID=UPI002AFF19D4|nr:MULTISPECIES: hypothetical protein [unclassified Yoonia]
MKNLLATTAIVMVAMTGAASAQSVLERVLGKIDNATNLASVNGTFANIAENIGGAGSVTVYTNATGAVISEAEFLAAAALDYQADFVAVAGTDYVDPSAGVVITAAEYAALSAAERADYQLVSSTGGYWTNGSSVIADASYDNLAAANAFVAYTPSVVAVEGLAGVNGSINNTIDGIGAVTQQAIASANVSAIEYNLPTFDFGDMATTALGAVNTGEITLGVNSSVDNAKTSTTEALSSVMTQIGGSADTGALVLNIASNMTGINGSITNVMAELNGSMGNLSTTALGAVNTGEIISGVNAAVNGITGASAGQ